LRLLPDGGASQATSVTEWKRITAPQTKAASLGAFCWPVGALAMIGKYQPMRVGIWAAEG